MSHSYVYDGKGGLIRKFSCTFNVTLTCGIHLFYHLMEKIGCELHRIDIRFALNYCGVSYITLCLWRCENTVSVVMFCFSIKSVRNSHVLLSSVIIFGVVSHFKAKKVLLNMIIPSDLVLVEYVLYYDYNYIK